MDLNELYFSIYFTMSDYKILCSKRKHIVSAIVACPCLDNVSLQVSPVSVCLIGMKTSDFICSTNKSFSFFTYSSHTQRLREEEKEKEKLWWVLFSLLTATHTNLTSSHFYRKCWVGKTTKLVIIETRPQHVLTQSETEKNESKFCERTERWRESCDQERERERVMV